MKNIANNMDFFSSKLKPYSKISNIVNKYNPKNGIVRVFACSI